MTLELSGPEVEMLTEVLRSYLSDLRMEIADTDRQDFREMLKGKERFLKSLLERLGA